ncbi:MAG: trigger factor [Lachnospiraceae bacterium]|nr:trigger factor [Lachnospiraceae bacterium]
MSSKVEKLENNMAKLTIEVPVDEFEKAVQTAYEKSKKQINIPGFRKGKAPRKLIENMYGKEVFFEDAANEIMPEAYAKAVEESGEEIVSSPKINVVQLEAGKPFIFEAEVALKPAVTLGKYKGISVEKEAVEVTAEEVDAQINKERENSAREVSVDRPVKDGDIAVIDFEGFVDGVAFEGGKGENHPLTIGSGQFIPGFEEQLIGAKIGEDVDVNVTFPENYQATELAGKAAVFKCKVHEIKEKELPELDDEFASEVSEFDTFKEYRADVEKKLTEQKENAAKTAFEDAVVKAVIADAQMDIPDAMVETQQRQMLDDYDQRLRMQGLSLEQYLQFTGQNPQQMMDQLKDQAMFRIQSRLVLEEVVKAEKIEASDEDVQAEIKRMAEQYNMTEDKVKEILGEGEMKNLSTDLAVQKAVDFLTENAKATKAKAPAKKTAAKKTTKKTEEAAEDAAEEAAEEKPKKTTRKTTKKTEEAAEATEEKPKKRTTKKKTEE